MPLLFTPLPRRPEPGGYLDKPSVKRWTFALLCGLFVLLLNPRRAESATLVYSTYFGGTSNDMALAVAVDSVGNAYVAGQTESTNGFPILNAFQPNYAGGFMDAFLAKFDPAGRLLFSTYFGGSGWDVANSIALDLQGNIVVVGLTTSTDLPTTDDAFQPGYGGGSAFGTGDGFIAKFTPDGSRLLYCSYFGGSLDDRIDGVAIDASGNVCINGQTGSTDLPLKNALQPMLGGGDNDGFIA
ncbi:MAG: SBBP repeat-containing protein, partial [Verrucomicrobia bacterium]|nr:SBBP repeat-containing protein [Verrucomicrobiota bacterium]